MRKAVVAGAIVLLLVLAACGSTAKPAVKAAPAPKVVAVSIAGGAVTPQGKRVELKVGQEDVVLRVSSDVDEEIHVHSEPEHEYEVPAGTAAKDYTFAIATPGQVAVESHGLGVTIVVLVVRP